MLSNVGFILPNFRQLNEEELDMMAWTMEKIFTCDMSSLPTAMLIHTFWGYFSANSSPDIRNYSKCMEPHFKEHLARKQSPRTCQGRLLKFCPRRFDGKSGKMKLCREILYNNGKWFSNSSRVQAMVGNANLIFDGYFKCVSLFHDVAKECAYKYLDTTCRTRSIRAIKTVRTPLEVPERLLQKYPNFKIFHLLRDPRGAVKSRIKAFWSWGTGEGKTVKEHAKRYCPSVVKVHRIMKALEKIGTMKK